VDNKTSGRVDLPEAGEGAYLQLDINALEKLETAYPDKEEFVAHVIKGLAELRPSFYRVATDAMLHGAKADQLPFGLTWMELNVKLLDAIHYAIHGKSYETVRKEHEEKMIARLKGLQEDPEMATALQTLFSQAAGEQAPSAD
jgi:hypothetical protein